MTENDPQDAKQWRESGSTPGPRYCQHCGTSNPPDATYCNGCGKMLNA